MAVVFALIGALQVLGGLFAYSIAQSAMNVLGGAILVGMGCIMVGIAILIEKAARQAEILEKIMLQDAR